MQEPKPIHPLSAVFVVILTFFLIAFVGAAFFLLFGIEVALILGELLVIVIPLGYMILKHINIADYIKLGLTPKNVLLGIAFGILLLFVDGIITNLLYAVFGPSQAVEESNRLITEVSSYPQGRFAVIITLCLAGICEEFTFRGFLQNAISRRYSFIPAVLVSSLAFGFFHTDPQFVYIISAFVMGLILGFIYHRWQSYTTAAIAHSTVNVIVLLVLLFVPA